jgi:pyridoxal phosphate enzyme (YggS family)
MTISENIRAIKKNIPDGVTLVAVTKTKKVKELMEAYQAGQRVFGENKVQEMEAKWQEMPKDVQWHMIGHVQRNKVKYMAPFVSLIHAVDSLHLLKEIDKQAKNNERVIDCLLQIKIAKEESKFGLTQQGAVEILASEVVKGFKNVRITGLMGMATFTNDMKQIASEFQELKKFFDKCRQTYPLAELSMGMSADHEIALKKGSTMIRVGSAIFGDRNS